MMAPSPSLAPSPRAGFTLVEMMVVLLIAGLLVCAGVPGFQSWRQQRQLAHAADAFFHSVNLTRTLALRHGYDAVMRPLQEDNWASGWQVSAAGQVVMRQDKLAAGITVEQKKGGGRISFAPSGRPRQGGTWIFRLPGQGERRVVLNVFGRVRQARGA